MRVRSSNISLVALVVSLLASGIAGAADAVVTANKVTKPARDNYHVAVGMMSYGHGWFRTRPARAIVRFKGTTQSEAARIAADVKRAGEESGVLVRTSHNIFTGTNTLHLKTDGKPDVYMNARDTNASLTKFRETTIKIVSSK